MRSTVAGGYDFNESSTTSVGDTFPEDSVSNSGQSELTLEVSAGRKLDVVGISWIIVAEDNFTIDWMDTSTPVSKVNAVEILIFEILFVWAAVLTGVGLKEIVVLIKNKFLICTEISDSLVDTIVKTAKIMAVISVDISDLAEDILVDTGDSWSKSISKDADSSVEVILGILNSLLGLDVNQKRAEQLLRNGDGLDISLVGIGVEFNAISWTGRPFLVVNGVAGTDFSFSSIPSINTSVEVVPWVKSEGGGVEVSVNDQVWAVVNWGQLDVIDNQTVSVTNTCTIEGKSIGSSFNSNCKTDVSNFVVCWDQTGNNSIVKENNSLGSDSTAGSNFSSWVVEFKFVGQSLSSKGVVDLSIGNEFVAGVEGEVLGDLEVRISIEFANLWVPVKVVDISPSDFNTFSWPSLDAIVDVPSSELGWYLETSIDDNVLRRSDSNELDVVNGQT